ncbi:MAG: hypothetical protein R3C58_10490 [Parvularculaceae bacterium]
MTAVQPGALKKADLSKPGASDADKPLRQATHATIAGVTDDIDHFRFNKAVRAFMNSQRHAQSRRRERLGARRTLSALTRLISPPSRRIAEESWEVLGGEG